MNQREWKPEDHGLRAERIGTMIMALAGGLMLAGTMFFALLMLALEAGH
ncbi:hypothetical protein ACFXB3_34480 [Streptomyces sp. NPDC059447]